MIKFKNGEKEMFNEVPKEELQGNAQKENVKKNVDIVDLSPELIELNRQKREYYNRPLVFDSKKIGKDSKELVYRFNVSEQSVLENEDVEMIVLSGHIFQNRKNSPKEFIIGVYGVMNEYNPVFRLCVRNKTNRTIYVDLSNTFFVTMGKSVCYYVPTSTTTTSSSSKGVGVNMGAVTGALGVGGVVGTLANGVNVGGGSTSGTSNTTYSQRVISIAPHATYTMAEQYLFEPKAYTITRGLLNERHLMSSYDFKPVFYIDKKVMKEKLTVGNGLEYQEKESPLRMSFSVSYSYTENCSSETTLPISLYLSSILGTFRLSTPVEDMEGMLLFKGDKPENYFATKDLFPLPSE